jgi:hypothetical protein
MEPRELAGRCIKGGLKGFPIRCIQNKAPLICQAPAGALGGSHGFRGGGFVMRLDGLRPGGGGLLPRRWRGGINKATSQTDTTPASQPMAIRVKKLAIAYGVFVVVMAPSSSAAMASK